VPSGASSISFVCSFRHNQYFTAPPFPDRYENRYETQRRKNPGNPVCLQRLELALRTVPQA